MKGFSDGLLFSRTLFDASIPKKDIILAFLPVYQVPFLICKNLCYIIPISMLNIVFTKDSIYVMIMGHILLNLFTNSGHNLVVSKKG